MKIVHLLILAVALLGFGACTNQTTRKLAKAVNAPPPTEEQEFGEVRLELTQELDGKEYIATGMFGIWILVERSVGLERFSDDPWWELELTLDDGDAMIIQELYADTLLEIAPLGRLRCYVDRKETDCEFIETVPTPLVIQPDSRALAEIHVAFGSDVTVIYSGETQLGLVVHASSDEENCPSDTRAYVSLFDAEPECINQCGVSCDGCQTVYGCASGEACIVPVDGLGLPGPPGVCAPDM